MGAILALIGPLLPGIIKGIEGAFSGKPKSGDEKMSTLFDMARALIAKLIAAKVPLPDGTVLTEQPPDDALRGALEAIFQGIKGSGQLAAPVVEGQLYILRGTVTAIK